MEKRAYSADSYKVGMGLVTAVAWLGIVFFGGLAILAFHDHQYGPVWAFVGFDGLGLFLLLMAGRFTFDQEGITHQNAFGIFRIRWGDVRGIEHGSGQIVLKGDHSRFVIPPPTLWSGPQKSGALALLAQKIEASGIVPVQSNTAAYKWPKNVRVPPR